LNRRKPEEDTGKMSIAELNLELDNNSKVVFNAVNEMLYLINRRKQLILYKRKKLKD
jgi:hypothetical protein